jgi:hypothetical protein
MMDIAVVQMCSTLPKLMLEINMVALRTGALGGHQWLTPLILATWEAEIKRIMIQSQPGQKYAKPYLKNT